MAAVIPLVCDFSVPKLWREQGLSQRWRKRYCVSFCYSDLKAPCTSESLEAQSEPGFLVCSSLVCGHGLQQGFGVSGNFEKCLS